MHSFVILLSLNPTSTSNKHMFCPHSPLPLPNKILGSHNTDSNYEFAKYKLLRNHLCKSVHCNAQNRNTHCQCFFFSTRSIFYCYVNLLPANYATASETELPYLSIGEHGDNLNPVFKDILYAAFYKRKEMY